MFYSFYYSYTPYLGGCVYEIGNLSLQNYEICHVTIYLIVVLMQSHLVAHSKMDTEQIVASFLQIIDSIFYTHITMYWHFANCTFMSYF
jgi:hypothetical protein